MSASRLSHDAIMYATDVKSVRASLGTAYRHCRSGGTVLLVPDCVRETFAPGTTTGGEDGPDGRGLRYLEWTWDPDPAGDTFEAAFAFLLREADGSMRVESDRHRLGLFSRTAWVTWMKEAGFSARSSTDQFGRDLFLGTKPASSTGDRAHAG